MSDEPDGIAIMDQRVVAGDFLVDRDQHFLFPDELQQVAELYALSLNHLPNSHGRDHFAGHIPLAVGCLELSHQ